MRRSPCCSKEGLNRGAWTAQEDQILSDYVKAHGEGRWRTLPKRAGLNRCGKSCRLRWLNYLRPDIKRGNITDDEEELIIRMHKLLGNRWSLIAGRLPGRTDNEIKNYWHTNLVRKLQQNQAPSSTQKRPSPGKAKNPADKRRKSEGKQWERRAVRSTAMRRMDTMNDSPGEAPVGGTEAKKEEAIDNVPTDLQDPSQEGLLLPEALAEGLTKDAEAAGCQMSSDLLNYELLKFPDEEVMVKSLENDSSNNKNEDKEFAEPNYVFDEAMLEELMRVDTCTQPYLPSELEPLCAVLDPIEGWL